MAFTDFSTSEIFSWVHGVPPCSSILAAIDALPANIREIFPLTHRGDLEIQGCWKIIPCFGGGEPVLR
jgi:hypothetical protein